MEAHEKINLHSEELREVLGTPPRWLVRWGTTFAVFGFLVLLSVAYFVKYPDVIEAPLAISALNPPVNLISERNGSLEAILITDDQQVKSGDLLAVYSSTANLLDIDTLEADLAYFSGELSAMDIENFTPRRNLQLGDVQNEYANFLNNFDKFTYGSVSNNDQKSIQRIRNQISSLQNSIGFEKSKFSDLVQRDTIANREMRRLKRNYSSDVEKYGEYYRQAIQNVKRIEKEYTDLESVIKGKELAIQDKRKEIAEINQQSGVDNSSLRFEINQNIEKLKGQINTWKKANLLYAPIDGRAIFYQEFDNENQTVQVNTKILKIIPPGEVGEAFGKVDLPKAGSGKVEEGQTVIIKIDNYPFHEYGMLEGIVRFKSDVPQENNTYKVEVDLKNGLLTNRGNKLTFTQGLQGTAEIITKERRFLFRLFENVFDF